MTDQTQPLVASLVDLLTAQGDQAYRQFLTVPALSVGLFAAPRGHVDTQAPHEQDEVYVVVSGSGVLDVEGVRTPVSAGSVAYVPARVPHHFLDVTEDLRVVVVFSPPYDGPPAATPAGRRRGRSGADLHRDQEQDELQADHDPQPPVAHDHQR
jgi:mannose-6-phosphate isomerase-like protein (cupin superfamily)